jgi:hypothetical protein
VRHHFSDSLDREGAYWTIVPNRERHAYRLGDVTEGCADVTIVTLGKGDEHWERVLSLPNLEELTLHEPSKEQLTALGSLPKVRRLRITHARPKALDFLAEVTNVEELVLEYVSGCKDLAPLRQLPHLRALHLENLRQVADFEGLSGCTALRYLSIHGTLDWKQPIRDFEFLHGLPSLEVLHLSQVVTKAPYPALLPVLSLQHLARLQLASSFFETAEYALLEEGFSHAQKSVEGATWGPYRTFAYRYIPLPSDDERARLSNDVLREEHPEVILRFDGGREIADPDSLWIEFTGKGAGRVKCSSSSAEAKCRAQAERYAALKEAAQALLEQTQQKSP